MTYRITPSSPAPIKLNVTDAVTSVLQNVTIILSTWEGTVPLYRDFGITSEYMHKPIPAAKALLHAEIREKVERYEPRVSVVGITFKETGSGLIPTLEVEVLE